MWILVGLLLVTALLLCPVTGRLAWDQCLAVQIRYLFFKIKVYPPRPKKEKNLKKNKGKKKKKTAEPPKEEKKEKLTAQAIGQLCGMVSAAVKSAKKPVKLLLRHLKIKNVKLFVLVSGPDACETAIRYGKLNAAVYSTLATVKNIVTVRRTSIEIRPDFTEAEEQAAFQGEVCIAPLFALAAGVVFAVSFLKEMVAKKKKGNMEKKGPAQG